MGSVPDIPSPPQPPKRFTIRRVVIVFALALLYALFVRMVFGWEPLRNYFPIVSVSFLTTAPMSFGALTTFLGYRICGQSPFWDVAAPMLVTFLGLTGSILTHLEAMLCVIVACPIMLPMAALGGWIMHWILWRPPDILRVTFVVLLPFLAAPLESQWKAPHQTVSMANAIEINASPPEIWAEIASVRRIGPEELPFQWIYLLDFPRPISAEIDRDGIGARRHATFERNVSFFETVTEWEPGRAIAFTIKADPDFIPHTAFDQHIIVGGRFYDVLDGRYRIERQGRGCRLVLTSTHRLSTPFNRYAGWWSRWVMSQVQNSILEVVKKRAEASAQSHAQPVTPEVRKRMQARTKRNALQDAGGGIEGMRLSLRFVSPEDAR